jgi:tRNA (guanine-N7-)-methyltransferase
MKNNKRLRNHANPFSFREPITRDKWKQKLKQNKNSKKIIVDLGCGNGEFIIENAQKFKTKNYIGIDLRESIIEKNIKKIQTMNLNNIIFLHGNANISITTLFKKNEIDQYHIHFPDPWFKEKHKKRRILTSKLIDELKTTLKDKGKIILITDIEEIYIDFNNLLLEKNKFKKTKYHFKYETTRWQNHKKNYKIFKSCYKKA